MINFFILKVLDDIYQYHLPPTRRIPPLLWTRVRSDLPGKTKDVHECRLFYQFYSFMHCIVHSADL